MSELPYEKVVKQKAEWQRKCWTLEAENQQLLARLDEAVSVIETWHGPEAWDIYYTHSPEMKRVTGVVEIVNPEGG